MMGRRLGRAGQGYIKVETQLLPNGNVAACITEPKPDGMISFSRVIQIFVLRLSIYLRDTIQCFCSKQFLKASENILIIEILQ